MDAAVSVTEVLSITNKNNNNVHFIQSKPSKKNCTVLTANTLTGEYPGNRPAQKSLYPRMTLWKMVKRKK